jgi:hypothetical protein
MPSPTGSHSGRHDGPRDEVDAVGTHDDRLDQLTGDGARGHLGDGRGAVGVRVLVRGVARPRAGTLLGREVLGEQHLDVLADPVLRALGGELLDEVGDPADAGVDLGLVQLARQG